MTERSPEPPDIGSEAGDKTGENVTDAQRLTFGYYLSAWNARCGRETPGHHVRIAEWLDLTLQEGSQRLLLMAFRGAGKSTVIGLFCAWLLTVRPDLRILTLSADEALARRMLRSARKAIERHPKSLRPSAREARAMVGAALFGRRLAARPGSPRCSPPASTATSPARAPTS